MKATIFLTIAINRTMKKKASARRVYARLDALAFDFPDYISIDLDPSDKSFAKAITTAQAAKQLLEDNQLTGFIKTSGKTGLHIYVPCRGFTFQDARTIAQRLCTGVHELVPRITTTAVSIEKRGTKLFVDPSQNDYADTLAAPYCVRPWSQPTVSTPLEWNEVKAGLSPEAFTIESIEQRLAQKKDPWRDLFNSKIIAANSKHLKLFL